MSRTKRNSVSILASVAMAVFLIAMVVAPASGADVTEEPAATDAVADVPTAAPVVEEEVAAPPTEPAEQEVEAAASVAPAPPASVPSTTSGTGGKAKLVRTKVIREQRGGGSSNSNSNN